MSNLNRQVAHHADLAREYIARSKECEGVVSVATLYVGLYADLRPQRVTDDFDDPYLRGHMNGFRHRIADDLEDGIRLGVRALAGTVAEAARTYLAVV
ncbi:MAG: hypothetical protein ACREGJ_02950 [Candidatus Saccharimonadales bacterium]